LRQKGTVHEFEIGGGREKALHVPLKAGMVAKTEKKNQP